MPAAPATITPRQAIASRQDLWGNSALNQPGGPSYAYFEQLLPPLRYVGARFHYYPIPLCAPGSRIKGRLVSNGSAINALARQPNWKNETGTPVHILLGDTRQPFGKDLQNLKGPRYLDGYLPIVQLSYTLNPKSEARNPKQTLRSNSQISNLKSEIQPFAYSEELFASVDSHLSPYGAILACFTFPAVNQGRIELKFSDGYEALKSKDGQLIDPKGRVLASFDGNWEWNPFHGSLISKTKHARTAFVAIYTVPISAGRAMATDGAAYDQQRDQCRQFYDDLINRGMTVNVPEQYVNDAWRSLLIGTYGMTIGDQLNYSASNQYARMYPAETGDAIQTLLLWGHAAEAASNLSTILHFTRPKLLYHDTAFNLETVAAYYRLTHDQEYIRSIRGLWQRDIDRLVGALQNHGNHSPSPGTPGQGRGDGERNPKPETRNPKARDKGQGGKGQGKEEDGKPNSSQIQNSKFKIQNIVGLLPREQYCSDIPTVVNNLATNAVAWQALHDMAPVLADLGQPDRTHQLNNLCAQYRKTILAAIDKYIDRSVDPPFISIALGEEHPHNPITATRLGSYWNLVIGYVLSSGVFPYDSNYATDILHYQQQNGGLCMGMIRCQSARSFWISNEPQNIDDLYGIRYVLTLLKRDEPDRALVSFYGKLAQGMTRDTFIDGEASSILPLDKYGRQMYLPPNSTANASFLQQLRYILIQDWDLHDSGHPDTLRLLFATPRLWLADGKAISVQNAPTAFGSMSMTIYSHINSGNIEADLDLPDQSPKQTLIRFRLPVGHKLLAASAEGKDLKIKDETIDLTGITGHVVVEAKVE